MIRLWVNDINTTSFRIVASVLLAALTVLLLLIGITLRNWFPTDMQLKVVYAIGGGLLVMMGLDVTQFIGKRFSDAAYVQAKQGPSPVTVEAPSTVTVTDATDAAPVVAPAPAAPPLEMSATGPSAIVPRSREASD